MLDRTAIVMCADHGMQTTAEGEPVDLSASLHPARAWPTAWSARSTCT
ncbi:MAG: hypothetical protein R2695_08150 [Acidimicrobiales bacterium]